MMPSESGIGADNHLRAYRLGDGRDLRAFALDLTE